MRACDKQVVPAGAAVADVVDGLRLLFTPTFYPQRERKKNEEKALVSFRARSKEKVTVAVREAAPAPPSPKRRGSYGNHTEATNDIADYLVGFYNAVRLHSKLGNMSPNAFERESTSKKSIELSEIT